MCVFQVVFNPVNGLRKNRFKNRFAQILTCTEAVRPENLTIMGEISRRIRISGRKCLTNASRTRKLGKTNLRKTTQFCDLSYFSLFFFQFFDFALVSLSF